MRKKIILIFTLVILMSLSGCSRSKTATIKKTAPVKPATAVEPVKPAEPAQTSSIPAFDKTAVMKASGKSVPVLMYHSIDYEKDNPIRLPVKRFEEQLKYLKDNGYYTITLTNLYEYLIKDIPIPEKSIVLTFDDGYEDNYTDMFPVLKKYNFKATIFVITGSIDKSPNYMTSKQLVEMEKYGVEIGSHTVKHENLKEMPKDKQLETLVKSKKDLEKILNKQIKFFSYPYGGYSKTSIEAVREAGYTMAFSTDGRWSSKEDGILSLHRVYISSFHDMEEFKKRISNTD
ncbi:polysaccharide deacetylase family protein [Clostridium sp. CM027]|uniref:polysaccharide deacetylase family protein n=1 Tax=Clostridium sp. CM027 TaxID=2849865 RepID=UPI001C6F11D4|nr:polysaccharide deacetylase family protein [Clostridium sp. CM027]MBW9145997.1 polysaccharide deacetylase family protein [Clostridium sp. CM027]UVE39467.1 polysaccharide deacetylase family protein [Clostridium sp. CM027]